MKITITRAKETHLEGIVQILEKLHASAGFSECAEFDYDSAKKFTQRLMASQTAEVLIALDEEAVIGLSTFIVDSPYFNWAKKVASGVSFWVDLEYRKSGVGKALYSASEKRAKAMGCEVITVGVMIDDKYLQEYHERNGFKSREVLLHKEIQ